MLVLWLKKLNLMPKFNILKTKFLIIPVYITTNDFNKFSCIVFDERLKQTNLANNHVKQRYQK